MKLTDISDRISYLPASDNPLSDNVVIIKGNSNYWIYDVGANEDAVSLINNLPGKKNIVLSHFHQDHIGNLSRIKYDSLYAGTFTTKKIRQGTTVSETIYIDDGVRLCIFPLPSTHSKGAVGLAGIAVERRCGRLEWWCLDWNRPSIAFYLSLGAEPMRDWTVYRISGETLKKLAE